MHNLTANRDSITSLKIAEESTKFAQETRRDSDSMKMIVKLTMLYLPATFVCSFFGINFFALPGPAELRGFQTLAGVCCDYGAVDFIDIRGVGSVDEIVWQEKVEHSAVKTHIY